MDFPLPIGSMYGIYANIWGILMVNVTIYSIHGSYGLYINHPNLGVSSMETFKSLDPLLYDPHTTTTP